MKRVLWVGALATAAMFVVEGCLGIAGDFNFDGAPGGSPEAGPPADGAGGSQEAGPAPDGAGGSQEAGPAPDGAGGPDGSSPECPAGSFWESAASNCEPCPSGQFTAAESSATACSPWADCAPGTYVSAAGSSSSDRVCTTCSSGTVTTQPNQSSCLPVGACAAGTVQTAPATSTMAAVCAPCQSGDYCAGGTAPDVPCATGTWDNDANPATACVAQSQCGPGTYVSSAGSATADQACSSCASGSFSLSSNAAACTAWTACTPGQQIAASGSTTTDQTCQACPAGDFSATNNTACAAWTTCSPGQYASQAGTPSANRVCTACPAGQTTTTSNASACNTQYGVLNQSCTGLGMCRGSLMEACCDPINVPGGTFTQGSSTDGLIGDAPTHLATVSAYQLEEFEVTVGRFRNFVNAYVDNTTANAPAAGAGANPNISGTGWNTAWTAFLPASQAALVADLKCDANQSWTDAPGTNETSPINCVSWYEAFAFCIWDGERLATESEWEFATAGGNDQDPYPWGTSPAPSCLYANYQGCVGAVRGVGLATDDNSGRWSQYDLLGNVAEWNFDSYSGYPNAAVTNYVYSDASPTTDARIYRGAGFSDGTTYLNATARRYTAPSAHVSDIGVRCAH